MSNVLNFPANDGIQTPPKLHCPFCGNKPTKCIRPSVRDKKVELFKIKCSACECQTKEFKHPKEAWDAWDSRIAQGFIPEGAELL